MKNLYLLTGILTASVSTALATTPAPAPVALPFVSSTLVGLRPTTPGARPDNAADRLNGTGMYGAVDQFGEAGTSAGVRSKTVTPIAPGNIFSISGEYNFINTNDSRLFGSDLDTHSISLLGSAFLNGNTFLSLGYSYNNATSGVNILGTSSHSDAHFFSVVAARSFGFLSIGVAGGYGNTDYRINNRPLGITDANMDTWTVSPFVTGSYRTGRLTSSLTVAYEYENDRTTAIGFKNTDDTGKITVALRETFAISEALKLQAFAKFTDVLHGITQLPGLPQQRAWATFGTKVSYFVTKPFEIYAGYSYDAFNRYLETHTATAGVKYSF
jgi:hypothetical protein